MYIPLNLLWINQIQIRVSRSGIQRMQCLRPCLKTPFLHLSFCFWYCEVPEESCTAESLFLWNQCMAKALVFTIIVESIHRTSNPSWCTISITFLSKAMLDASFHSSSVSGKCFLCLRVQGRRLEKVDCSGRGTSHPNAQSVPFQKVFLPLRWWVCTC